MFSVNKRDHHFWRSDARPQGQTIGAWDALSIGTITIQCLVLDLLPSMYWSVQILLPISSPLLNLLSQEAESGRSTTHDDLAEWSLEVIRRQSKTCQFTLRRQQQTQLSRQHGKLVVRELQVLE